MSEQTPLEAFTSNMRELSSRLRAQGGMEDIALSIDTQATKSEGYVEHGEWRIPAGQPFIVEHAFTALVERFGGHSDQ